MKNKNYLRKWECALALAICFTVCYGAFALRSQQRLAEKVIRLHVVAQSDMEDDQQMKLKVRDSVLEFLAPELESASGTDSAAEIISGRLGDLELRAGELSGLPVKASLEYESFPTRSYGRFALPAGEYLSLRLTLGEGRGQNWWCVVFPPLCMSAAEEPALAADTLTDRQVELISGGDGEYVLRFKVLEYMEKIKGYIDPLFAIN